MAIVVEDGTVVANANSYVTESEAELYHEDRGNTAWASAGNDAEFALVRAAYAIENRYRGFWIGYMTDNNNGTEQSLAWPRRATRATAYDADEDKPTVDVDDALFDRDGRRIGINSIPTALKHAQMEAALIELTENVMPSTVDQDEFVKREKIGPIEVEYLDKRGAMTIFPVLDRYLAGLANTGGFQLTASIGLNADEQAIASGTSAAEQSWNDFFGVDVL